MARRTVDPIYLPFTVTTPAGTQIAAPQSTTLTVVHGTVLSVDVLVPQGHAGVTGLRLQLSGAPILPYSGVNNWIIGDGLQETFEVGIEADTKLVAVTYNIGNYPHSHFLRVKITTKRNDGVPAPVALVNLNAGGAQ